MVASRDLEHVALMLVADGIGILAADETVLTLTRRFDTLGIKSTEQSRRTYREMLFTSPGAAEFISGVIITTRRSGRRVLGACPPEALAVQGVIPGIEVDTGAKPLAGSPDETVTEGLDGLRNRLSEYRSMGARFAKWRPVIHVTDALPNSACVSANAHALARYAALCQEQELVPIVEPEVLMDRIPSRVPGKSLVSFSTLSSMRCSSRMSPSRRCCSSPTWFLRARRARESLRWRRLPRHLALLAPARAHRRSWYRIPVRRPERTSGDHASNAINRLPGPKPWKISFSYGRAL
jgi:fructose-bisphosphate aldolase class I